MKYKLAVIALVAIAIFGVRSLAGNSGNDDPPVTTHQVETFTFTNNTGLQVDGLTLRFDARDIKTRGTDVFTNALSTGKSVALSGAVLAPCQATVVTFERDGAFQMRSFEWTANGASIGGVQQAPTGGSSCGNGGGGVRGTGTGIIWGDAK